MPGSRRGSHSCICSNSRGSILRQTNPDSKKIKTNGIGTLQEKSLHAALKTWYAEPGDRLEVPVDGFLVDIVRGDLLIEIQTRNFSSLKRKILDLTDRYPVRLVYPIAQEKWIIRMDQQNDRVLEKRKSPKRGQLEHLFSELVRFPHLIAHPNFSIEVLVIREEEIRIHDGKGAWRRKGWSISDRRLIEVVDRKVLETPQSFQYFLPDSLEEPFTTREVAAARHIPRYLAQKMVYCLREMGLIEMVGLRRRSYLYRTNRLL